VGNFQVCDAISVVNGQAAYTLQVGGVNVAPESANHMLVSLNGILQKPGSSFTISGSTMTFASNLATGDVIDFVQILGNVLDIGQPSDDTVTAAKLNNNIISGQTALTSSPASTDELLISDAGTLKRIDVSLVGSTNTPAFVAYKNTNQTISNDTYTKITFEAEQLDSDSTYDTSNSRFTPGVVGYYWIGAKWRYDTGTDFDSGRYALYKNGSNISKAVFVNQNTNGMTFSTIVYSDADDYFEMYGRQNSGSSQTVNGDSTYPEQDQAQFYAFRITGV
jgi:hypothetical protein